MADSFEQGLTQLVQESKEQGYVLLEQIENILPSNLKNEPMYERALEVFNKEGIEIKSSDGSAIQKELEKILQKGDEREKAEFLLKNPLYQYINDFYNIPLLTREEEIKFTKEINALKYKWTRSIFENGAAVRGAVTELERKLWDWDRLRYIVNIPSKNEDEFYRSIEKGIAKIGRIQKKQSRLLNKYKFCSPKHKQKYYDKIIRLNNKCAEIIVTFDPKVKFAERIFEHTNNVFGSIYYFIASELKKSREDPSNAVKLKDDTVAFYSAMECTMLTPKDFRKKYDKEVPERYNRYIEERNRFTEHNLRLVVSIAKKFVSRDRPILDLIQYGNFGLWRALERLRPGEYKFSTYATWWIRQSIIRAIRNPNKINISQKGKISIDDAKHLTPTWEDTKLTKEEEAIVRHYVKLLLLVLGKKERDVIESQFGIGKKVQTLEKIGERHNVGKQGAHQIKKRALEKLTDPKIAEAVRGIIEICAPKFFKR